MKFHLTVVSIYLKMSVKDHRDSLLQKTNRYRKRSSKCLKNINVLACATF